MARKKNQPKNKIDRNSSNLKSRVSELESSSIHRKGQGKIKGLKVVMDEKVKENQCVVSSDDPPQKLPNVSMKDNNDKTSILGASDIREGREPLLCSNHVQNHVEGSYGWSHNGLLKSQIEKFDISDFLLRTNFRNSAISRLQAGAEWMDTVLIYTLRTFASMVLKASAVWLVKQKPLFIATATNILKARDYALAKFEYGYPIVLRLVMHLTKIVLFISMVWLDCALRGIASFLCMGTASIFSVIWFSIFSVIAMSGIFKILMILAVSTFVGAFAGLTLAVFVVAFSGIVLLWLYGNFWLTFLIIFIAGLIFFLCHEHLALLIATVYSFYCVWAYIGWTGLFLGFNLSFISSDVLVYLIKSKLKEENRIPARPQDQSSAGQSSDRCAEVASTSGVDAERTSEDEVLRLLNCTDHYSALGFSRFETIDNSLLKREYKKKAMLVHPDKNMGNEKAAEAFKKLQNAYEVLFDSLKRRAYDDGLKREELLNYFRGFQTASQKQNIFSAGFAHSEGDGDGMLGESRRISCKRCGKFHIWVHTDRSKSRARWCQDCKEFHEAKDGDGWVEQYSRPFFFGLLHKVDTMCAYVCAENRVYDATEWYICQGARCAWNSHKASFHVNTKWNGGSGSSSSRHRGRGTSKEDSGEEMFEWFHNAMFGGSASKSGSNNGKKKKGM